MTNNQLLHPHHSLEIILYPPPKIAKLSQKSLIPFYFNSLIDSHSRKLGACFPSCALGSAGQQSAVGSSL